MRRFQTFALVATVAVAAAACEKNLTVETGFQPTAGVRFVNAVPDSAGVYGMDMRFVDLVESNAHFRIAFRNNISSSQPFVSSQIQYKGALAGSRHFKVFLDDSIQAVAQTTLSDQTQTLVDGHNYTGIMWGYGRATGADKMRFDFWEEDFSALPTLTGTAPTQVGIRIINAMNSAIDVRVYRGTTANAALAAAGTLITVPAMSKSTYMLDTAGQYMVNVRAAGGAVNLFADARALPGEFARCSGSTTTSVVDCVAPFNRVWSPDSIYASGTLVRGSATDTMTYKANAANGPTTAVGVADPTGNTALSHSTWTIQPSPDIEASPGVLVRGSAVSAIVFPRVAQAVPAPGAPVATVAGAAGNVDPGTYRYRVTFVTASGETQGGTQSATVTVATAGQVNLTAIPVAPAADDPANPAPATGVNPTIIARNIYRTIPTGTFLVGTIADNTTTTFTDNMSNAVAATKKAVPSSNTTIKTPQGAAFQAPAISWMWDKRPPRGCLPLYCGQ